MGQILDYLAVLSLWALLGSIVILIDPEILRDVVIPGSYLPILILMPIVLYATLNLVIAKTLVKVLIVAIITLIIGFLLVF